MEIASFGIYQLNIYNLSKYFFGKRAITSFVRTAIRSGSSRQEKENIPLSLSTSFLNTGVGV